MIRRARWPLLRRPRRYRIGHFADRLRLGTEGIDVDEPGCAPAAAAADNGEHRRGVTADLTVNFSGTVPFGALRGGGSRVKSYHIMNPGAGVADWFDDSYYEEAERNVMDWRREQVALEGASNATHSISLWDALGMSDSVTVPPIIRGEGNGIDTIMCSRCMVDLPWDGGGWSWCRCAAVVCDKCATLQCLWCHLGIHDEGV